MGVAGIYLRPEPKLTHKCVLFGMYVRPEAQGSGLCRIRHETANPKSWR
ncbi:MAG: hypothetical protein JKX93_10060 [Rhizobiaceae bacterium]|nr:hypothetical protein [Rhizobiaceae bacterium]MBL4696708.1 hypothetical protein [Rhizobiaceae bacterium]